LPKKYRERRLYPFRGIRASGKARRGVEYAIEGKGHKSTSFEKGNTGENSYFKGYKEKKRRMPH